MVPCNCGILPKSSHQVNYLLRALNSILNDIRLLCFETWKKVAGSALITMSEMNLQLTKLLLIKGCRMQKLAELAKMDVQDCIDFLAKFSVLFSFHRCPDCIICKLCNIPQPARSSISRFFIGAWLDSSLHLDCYILLKIWQRLDNGMRQRHCNRPCQLYSTRILFSITKRALLIAFPHGTSAKC